MDTAYLHPAIVDNAVYLGALVPADIPVDTGQTIDIDATKVPSSRRVVFEGSKRVVSFEGSLRKVKF